MKIVILTPTLYDEHSPFNHLFKDILEGWLDAGHEIVRIVACTNENDEDYKMGISSRKISYIPVVRKRVEKSNIIVRYLKDTLTNMRMAKKIKSIKDADVLFEDVSYASFWSVSKAKKRGLKVVSMLQDVWPDNAVASNLIKDKGLIYKFFEFWQKKVYKKSDKIICISPDMKSFIATKGVPTDKIDIIYNWGYTDKTVNIAWEENEFVQKYDLRKEYFYAVYAGNIGKMQNVELILRAAELLKNNEKIRFLIVGDGVNREQIEQTIKEKDLTNITILPMQPSELATSVYSCAGVNLIPLVNGGIKTALPSKTGVVLSCGKPTVFCFGKDCAFSRTVENCCGVENVDCSSATPLAEAIVKMSEECIDCAIGAQELFIKQFTRKENVKKYIAEIEF